jgi:hypothetical protein
MTPARCAAFAGIPRESLEFTLVKMRTALLERATSPPVPCAQAPDAPERARAAAQRARR